MSLRIGSLCTGYAGLDMAVESVIGGELAWVADIDPGASAILAHRFPSLPNLGDISKTDWAAIDPVDILCAGFPCQDVSCAGARAGLREGNRTGVWAYVARAIGEMRPPLVVLENVRGLLSFGADSNLEPCPWCMGDGGDESVLRACGAVLADLADLGFDAEWALVSAAEVGAPHRRERVFIVAWPAADAASPGFDGCARGHGEPQRGSERQGRPHSYGRAGQGVAPAADAHGTAGGERRIAAPGEAESRGPWTDAGGRGGAPAADSASRRCNRGAPLPLGQPTERTSVAGGSGSANGRDAAPDPRGARLGQHPGEPPAEEAGPLAGDEPSDRRGLRPAVDWGPYAIAIRRWEHITGRPAPRPTEPGRTGERLSPRFVEWMMGLPEGWVTDVPGLSRNAQLKALGNGVVPQQAAAALRLLLDRAGLTPLVAADTAPDETRGAA